MVTITIREARQNDAAGIAGIYNQGIEDRVATFENRAAQNLSRGLTDTVATHVAAQE